MDAYTPGPWHVEDIGQAWLEIRGDYRPDGSDAVVATVPRGPMAETNARLIAAAPELLRIAQAMLMRLDLQAREQGAAAVVADAALRADLGAAIYRALNG